VSTTRHNGRTPEAQAFRAERVIDAAIQLATDGGYDAVQMRDVARTAGVALGTLYRYYPSKDVLLSAAIASQVNQLNVDVGQRPPRQGTAEGRAAAVLVRAFHAMQRNRGFAHAAMSSYNIPKPMRDVPADPIKIGSMQPVTMLDVIAMAAWGQDHRTTESEYQALSMLTDLWSTSVIRWLNGWMTASDAEERFGFATKRLLAPGTPDHDPT
jgi:AcrR family transcriptional regulator